MLSIWLNWKEGYIKTLIDYLLRKERVRFSLACLGILLTPLVIQIILNILTTKDNLIERFIPLFAPITVISVAILKDFVDRERIKKALFNELNLNYKNLELLISVHRNLGSSLSRHDLYKNLENQWKSEVYDKYIDQIMSESFASFEDIEEWVDLYGLMKATLESIRNGQSTFTDDDFLFDVFLASKSDELGIMSRIDKILKDSK